MSKHSLRSAALALAGILIAIGGCAESPSAPAAPKFLERGPQPAYDIRGVSAAVIDSRGGTVTSLAGDRIVFPEGAVSSPVLVTLSSDRKYVGVELQPHGTTFAAGHEPTLILNAGPSASSSSTVVYTDDAGTVVEVLDTDVANGQVSASLHHFSKYYAVGG